MASHGQINNEFANLVNLGNTLQQDTMYRQSVLDSL